MRRQLHGWRYALPWNAADSSGMISRASRSAHFRKVDEELTRTFPDIRVREIRVTIAWCRRRLRGSLSETDLLGITLTWLIHARLLHLLPPGPLDARRISALRVQASRIALVS